MLRLCVSSVSLMEAFQGLLAERVGTFVDVFDVGIVALTSIVVRRSEGPTCDSRRSCFLQHQRCIKSVILGGSELDGAARETNELVDDCEAEA